MRSTLTRVGSVATGLALAGLMLAGCGSAAGAAVSAAPAAAANSAANSDDARVVIDTYKFGPDKLTVPVGTTVTWTNNDDDAHTVVAKDDSFRSGSLAKGQSYRFTFTKAGTYEYLCSIHPFMVATVTVTQ